MEETIKKVFEQNTYEYDKVTGNLLSEQSKFGDEHYYEYDKAGRLTHEKYRYADELESGKFNERWFNEQGNVKEVKLIDGRNALYDYDKQGKLMYFKNFRKLNNK